MVNYTDFVIVEPIEVPVNNYGAFLLLDFSSIVDGQYLDLSGNDYHADVVTITESNDGLQMADDEDLKDLIRPLGLYDFFFDIDGNPLPVLKSHIARIYNNSIFNNDDFLLMVDDSYVGQDLLNIMTLLFGIYDTDALNIITAIGVISELEKRLVDTHVKDLKALNSLQEDLFLFGDPDNSKIKVLYPIVGSVFDSVKYNWINPVDSDDANRLALFAGTLPLTILNTINFEGAGALTTFFNAHSKLASKNSFSYYSAFNLADGDVGRGLAACANSYEMGCIGTTGSYKGIALAVRRDVASHSICDDTYQNPNKGVQYAETNSKGFYLANKIADDNVKLHKNNAQIGSTVADAGASVYYNGNIILGGASEDGTVDPTKYSVLPCCYTHIGDEIETVALKAFQDAVIRLCHSKSYYFFPPDETEAA